MRIHELSFCILAIAILFAIPGSDARAQVGSPTLQVTDPAAVAVLRSLNSRVNALSKLATECAEKKLAPPERCFCRYPAEVEAVKKELQATLRAYPDWATRAVAWTDTSSGKPMGQTLAIAHLGPALEKCTAK
ncbi:MAG: hypothetical protein SF172_16985 [Burkholderiales bacterium]|nr:hypothetical protein [Burkholderiales bacterium]